MTLGIMHIAHSNIRLSLDCIKRTLCCDNKENNLMLCSFFLFQLDLNNKLISFLACTKTRSLGYLKCSAPSLHFAQVAGLFMKFEHHKMYNFFTSSNFQTLTGSYSHENRYFSPNPSSILLISLFFRQAHCLKHILTSGLINFDKSAFTKKAPN